MLNRLRLGYLENKDVRILGSKDTMSDEAVRGRMV